jgi:hypothetical protein
VGVFVLAALPWLAVHHAVNHAVGGTLGPANAVPEYLLWPGSGFTTENMTGVWGGRAAGERLLYLASLLLGKRGFLWHNPALLLAAVACPGLLRGRLPERPELALTVFWGAGTWLAYGLTSSNSSGVCCSVRWFVPLLAPGYYALALVLREEPRRLGELAALSGVGAILAAFAWSRGCWAIVPTAVLWPAAGAALAAWGACHYWQRPADHRVRHRIAPSAVPALFGWWRYRPARPPAAADRRKAA